MVRLTSPAVLVAPTLIYLSFYLLLFVGRCVALLLGQLKRQHVSVTQDGFLDADEVARWVLPGEVDHADNEAKHLIHETDTDKVDCVIILFIDLYLF